MKISFIGAGNVAWHLALAFENNHHQVCEIYSRNLAKAKELASMFYGTKATDDLDFSESKADIFFLCVSDDAFSEVCSKILLPENVIFAHTSGSKSLEDLHNLMLIHHDLPVSSAVFYPLMTFTKGKKLDLNQVPFCIESHNEDVDNQLISLAQQLSKTVYLVSSEERKTLHVAAVFACNFTNHLLALSKEIVETDDLEFDLLKPLIRETIQKALASDHPANVQTGPAIRSDKSTIHKHLEYLKNDEDLLEIYEILTESIQKSHRV